MTSKNSKQKRICCYVAAKAPPWTGWKLRSTDDFPTWRIIPVNNYSWLPPFTSRERACLGHMEGETTLSLGDLLCHPSLLTTYQQGWSSKCEFISRVVKVCGTPRWNSQDMGKSNRHFAALGKPCHGCYSIGEVYDSMARCHLTMLRFFYGSLVAGILPRPDITLHGTGMSKEDVYVRIFFVIIRHHLHKCNSGNVKRTKITWEAIQLKKHQCSLWFHWRVRINVSML